MFTIHKTDTGAVTPFEYMEAAAGDYEVGTFLRVREGKLTNNGEGDATVYLCMANKTVEDGELIPVVRVNDTMILKSTLSMELMEGEGVGMNLDVSSYGTSVNQDGMGIGVVIVALEGIKNGDTVYVRLK